MTNLYPVGTVFDNLSHIGYSARMSTPCTVELAKKLAVLEERMKTMQADLAATLESFRKDMAQRDTEAARRDTEAARRDKENTRWQIGLWVAAVVVLGFLIRWPG